MIFLLLDDVFQVIHVRLPNCISWYPIELEGLLDVLKGCSKIEKKNGPKNLLPASACPLFSGKNHLKASQFHWMPTQATQQWRLNRRRRPYRASYSPWRSCRTCLRASPHEWFASFWSDPLSPGCETNCWVRPSQADLKMPIFFVVVDHWYPFKNLRWDAKALPMKRFYGVLITFYGIQLSIPLQKLYLPVNCEIQPSNNQCTYSSWFPKPFVAIVFLSVQPMDFGGLHRSDARFFGKQDLAGAWVVSWYDWLLLIKKKFGSPFKIFFQKKHEAHDWL